MRMSRRPTSGLCGLLLLAACGDGPASPSRPPMEPPSMPTPPIEDPGDEQPLPPAPPPSAYAGPPVQAAFTPPQPGSPLRLGLQVPSGGYRLREDAVLRQGDAVVVRLGLEAPGSDEVVTMGLVELTHEVPWATLAGLGPFTTVRIEVAQSQRGVHYLVPPAHELARIVARPR